MELEEKLREHSITMDLADAPGWAKANIAAADQLRAYREALMAILDAPMIDHSDASRSAYGIARKALADAGERREREK